MNVSTNSNNIWFVVSLGTLTAINTGRAALAVFLPATVASGATIVVMTAPVSFPRAFAIAGNWTIRLVHITWSRSSSSVIRATLNASCLIMPRFPNLPSEYTTPGNSARMRSSSISGVPVHFAVSSVFELFLDLIYFCFRFRISLLSISSKYLNASASRPLTSHFLQF